VNAYRYYQAGIMDLDARNFKVNQHFAPFQMNRGVIGQK